MKNWTMGMTPSVATRATSPAHQLVQYFCLCMLSIGLKMFILGPQCVVTMCVCMCVCVCLC